MNITQRLNVKESSQKTSNTNSSQYCIIHVQDCAACVGQSVVMVISEELRAVYYLDVSVVLRSTTRVSYFFYRDTFLNNVYNIRIKYTRFVSVINELNICCSLLVLYYHRGALRWGWLCVGNRSAYISPFDQLSLNYFLNIFNC